jgi:hypothetical protein
MRLLLYVLAFGLAAAAVPINPTDEDDGDCLPFQLEHLSYKTQIA